MIFLNFILASNYSCSGATGGTVSQYPDCYSLPTEYTTEGSFDLKLAIAKDMLETVDWNEENQAKARQYLYDMLMQDEDLLNSRQEFLDFVEEYEATLHAVYEVSEGLRNIEKYDELFEIMLFQADSLIQIYTDSINFIYEERLDEEYSETLELLYYQINFLEQTKGNLISQRQALVEGELGEIIHDYVVSPELPSINNQYIERVYSDFLESGDNEAIIITEYNYLLAIANQCPAAGGQSVYRARAMLSLVNDSLEYNDAIACLQVGIYRELNSEIITLPFTIIPNPADNEIEIIFEQNLEGICSLKIINILGQENMNKVFDCKSIINKIDVSNLNNGVYFVKIYLNNNEQYVEKLIIAR